MDTNHGYPNNNNSAQMFIPKYTTLDRNRNGRTELTKVSVAATPTDDNLMQEVTHTCGGIKWGDRLNPQLFYCLTYLLAIVLFLIFVNLQSLPNLYYPTLENLLPVRLFNTKLDRTLWVEMLWCVHFVRRFGEVLFVYEYQRGIPAHEVAAIMLFHAFFSVWIGWSLNSNLFYRTPPDALFIPGMLLCFFGGVGNFISHKYLQRMSDLRYRHTPAPHRILPQGGCFQLVDCPHYFFEILTWIGFSLTAFTLASWSFTVATTIILVVRARRKHIMYQRVFKDQYPERQKALLPFIL